jgi:amino acid transporter/predicted transcriptional regulator
VAKDGKFGTFGGVYIPSLLTILGVIMYLRLPWILGNAGLWITLGIIGAAHIASICTGLSVSSIATDKKVGAGGPYYIISRSLGLPIGGAIGIALFFGMSFAVALHIVGFSESVISALGYEVTPNAIRIAGTLTLIAVTAVTFISTSLAITTQYPIFVIVVLSIIAIFLGRPETTPAEPHLTAHASSPSFALMFGIFFPAATGFMSGVNMSGDLRDPKTSIIRGTILASVSALVLYVVLTIFMAYMLDPQQMREDREILQHMAFWGPAVIAGIWGATLSSAFGAVLGAPRILQAISADRITPHALAKGHGQNNEPRRATLVAFAIAEAGILLAELNLIARIVSMIYLAQYAAINLACVLESWASPDFRPKFRVPKLVPITGAVACVLLMIQLDLLAMMGATALMIGLFVYLQRRKLLLESGDAWEGVWSTLVRAGLHRMHKNVGQQRNWRPNVMLFDEANHPAHPAIRGFAISLASGNGIVTDFALAKPVTDSEEELAPADTAANAEKVGVFDTTLRTENAFETIAAIAQHHGFSGLPPNTLLLPWRLHDNDPDGFLRVLNTAAARDLNILCFDEPRDVRSLNQRIDVWWAREAGNFALSVALARFITRAPEWERAKINVLIVGSGGDDDEVMRARAVRYLESNRVEATVRVMHRPHGEMMHDLVCNESRTADLVLVGLPVDLGAADRESLARLERIASLPGGVLFMRANGSFGRVLGVASSPVRKLRPDTAATPPLGVPTLTLPKHPELATAVGAVTEHGSQQFARIHDRVASAYRIYLDVLALARGLVERRADAMIAAVRVPSSTKRRKVLATATSDFLAEGDRALAELVADRIPTTATILGDTLRDLVAPGKALPEGMSPQLEIHRPRAELRASAEDALAVRAWKRRTRWRYFYRRQIPQTIAIGALAQREHDRIVRDEVVRLLERLRAASHDLAVEVGRALASAEWKAHAQLARTTLDDPDTLVARITDLRTDALRRIDGISTHTEERILEQRAALDVAITDAARKLSELVDRVDAPLAAREALRGRKQRDDLDRLAGSLDTWRDEQLLMLARAQLAVQLAKVRDRLTLATTRALDEIVTSAHASGFRACTELRAALAKRVAEGTTGDSTLAVELGDEVPYDQSQLVSHFSRGASSLTAELPEFQTLLTDDAASALVRGGSANEQTTVPVRAAVQAIVEADLIARLASEVQHVAEADARAWVVARETIMLVTARPRDNDDDEAVETQSHEDAIARLDAQLARLREVEEGCVQGVLDGLQAVASASALESLAATLAQRGGRRTVAGQGPSRLRELVRRGASAVRHVAANMVYRRSAGLVYAQESRARRAKTPEQTIRELAERSTIAPAVASALPVYYRNLFTGQININESFFVGRLDKVKNGVATVTGERPGLRSALVTGNRGSGRTTLCQQIAGATQRDVFWVAAPPGGACTAEALRAAMESSLGMRGTPANLAARLPDGAVIVLDDLDTWWERRRGGLAAIDAIIDLIGETGDRIGYVLSASDPALRVLQELRPLSRFVYSRLECQPLSASALEQVIMARHSSTGLAVKLARRESLGSLTRARLFDAHFDFANGNVGYALRSWVVHIDACDGDELTIRVPTPLDWDAMDDLKPDHVALLIELVLHKAATVSKLERLTERPASAIAEALSELAAIGLVVQNRRKVAQLNPFVQVPVLEWLARRDLA